MRLSALAPVAAIVMLAGCNLPAANAETNLIARGLFETIRTGGDLSRNPSLAPNLKTPASLAQLAAMRQSLPAGAPTQTLSRSWNYSSGTDGGRATLVHAYVYPDRTILAETVLAKAPGSKTWLVIGYHFVIEQGPPAGQTPPAGKGKVVDT